MALVEEIGIMEEVDYPTDFGPLGYHRDPDLTSYSTYPDCDLGKVNSFIQIFFRICWTLYVIIRHALLLWCS